MIFAIYAYVSFYLKQWFDLVKYFGPVQIKQVKISFIKLYTSGTCIIGSKTTIKTCDLSLNYFIIHSKYFPDSDWLKAHI